MRSKKKLVARRRHETHFLSNEEREKWIQDDVDSEISMARKRVEDAETAIKQEQEDMRNAQKVRLTTTMSEITFEEMLNAIWDRLSNLSSSDDGEDGEDEDDDEEDPGLGKLSKDDKPNWVMGKIPETVEHWMECFRHKQMTLDEWRQPGWGDAAGYFLERDTKNGTTELMDPAVVQLRKVYDAALSALTTLGERMESRDRIPGQSPIQQVSPRPKSSHMRLGSGKHHSQNRIPSLTPYMVPKLSLLKISETVDWVLFHPCISSPKLITIQKSEFDKDMVTAPAWQEECVDKLRFLTLYLWEKQFVFLFCYVSAFTSFQWPNCETC